MSPVTDDRLGELLRETFAGHEHLADADHALSVAAAALGGEQPRPRRTGRWVLAAASVVLVAGGLAFAARDDGSVPDTPGTTTSTEATTTRTDLDNRRDAFARLEEVVAGAAVPKGAERVRSAQAEGLGQVPVGIGVNQQTATRFYRLPGSLDSVLGAIPSTPFEGFAAAGTGETGDRGRIVSKDRMFASTDADVAHLSTQLVYSVARTADGAVQLRVDAIGEWRPARTTALTIDAASATGADVRLVRPPGWPPSGEGAGPVNSVRAGTLDAAAVRPLVAFVNAQYAAVEEVHGCAPVWGESRDELVVHTTDGDVTVTIGLGCLGNVKVARDGTTLVPGLEGGTELDALIQAALRGRPLTTSTIVG